MIYLQQGKYIKLYRIKSHPSRSMKKNRHLLPRILELRQLGALKATADNKPSLHKSWSTIMKKWTKFEV